MAALRPRRLFAASVVVVTAACSKGAPKPEDAVSSSGSAVAVPVDAPSPDAAVVVAPPVDAPAALLAVYYVTGEQNQCRATQNPKCPPNVACNPPPPQPIACPPGAGKSTSDGVHVGRLPDQTCALVDLNCEDVSCAHAATPCPTR